MPFPHATQREPFHAIPAHCVVNTEFPEEDGVQLIPSAEYSMVFPPCPPATQREPFHATLSPAAASNELPLPEAIHVIPS